MFVQMHCIDPEIVLEFPLDSAYASPVMQRSFNWQVQKIIKEHKRIHHELRAVLKHDLKQDSPALGDREYIQALLDNMLAYNVNPWS